MRDASLRKRTCSSLRPAFLLPISPHHHHVRRGSSSVASDGGQAAAGASAERLDCDQMTFRRVLLKCRGRWRVACLLLLLVPFLVTAAWLGVLSRCVACLGKALFCGY